VTAFNYEYTQIIDLRPTVKRGVAPAALTLTRQQTCWSAEFEREAVTVVERQTKRASVEQTKAVAAEEPEQLGRRERNKREKRQRIVDAAKQLFGTKGFAQTTTQEIAEAADIGTGTLFLYAKTKEDLLVMVFKDEMLETSKAAFAKVPATAPLVDQLMHVFNNMVAYHDRDIEIAKALLKEVTILTTPERRNDLRILMQFIYRGLAQMLIARQQTGKLRADFDAGLAAENLFAIYYLSLLSWLGGQTSKPQFLKRLRLKLGMAIDGLAGDKGEPSGARAKPAARA
jgi:AcrR family transcriptional regulator